MQYFIGTHKPHWLTLSHLPLFISNRTLATRKRLPRAVCDWALDSGGFTEINTFGDWQTTPEQYVAQVRRYASEIGRLQFASQQDWMCEPSVLRKTGFSIRQHQAFTVANFLTLKHLAPELPWMPVLQGWEVGDYLNHAELFERCGIELAKLPRVGVGSICRRSASSAPILIGYLMAHLEDLNIKPHAFGAKTSILENAGGMIASADSMAWSFHERKHKTGNQNKFSAAAAWYERTIVPTMRDLKPHAQAIQRMRETYDPKPANNNATNAGQLALPFGKVA
jgi:hypothetical protein